jgi:hypothetical protein
MTVQQIQYVTFMPAEEQSVPMPQTTSLLRAELNEDGSINAYYVAESKAPCDTPVNFYCLEAGAELPDTFPGRFFAKVGDWFVYFKPPAPPIRGKTIRPEQNPNDAAANTDER